MVGLKRVMDEERRSLSANSTLRVEMELSISADPLYDTVRLWREKKWPILHGLSGSKMEERSILTLGRNWYYADPSHENKASINMIKDAETSCFDGQSVIYP